MLAFPFLQNLDQLARNKREASFYRSQKSTVNTAQIHRNALKSLSELELFFSSPSCQQLFIPFRFSSNPYKFTKNTKPKETDPKNQKENKLFLSLSVSSLLSSSFPSSSSITYASLCIGADLRGGRVSFAHTPADMAAFLLVACGPKGMS